MTNGNWVCFECRTCVRRPTWPLITFLRPWPIGDKGNESVKCTKCNQSCRFLGPKIAVPPKSDVDGWNRLRQFVIEHRTALVEKQREQNTHSKHAVERQIRDLESRPKNNERDGLIKQLRDELAELP